MRTEKTGLHWFDRSNGVHVLLDDVSSDPSTYSIAPRTLSLALSNICDLCCHFCYRPRNTDTLPPAFVKEIAAVADELGSLEMTFGGGEPLLYPHLVELCRWIWSNTSLGVSLTTHGQRLDRNLASQLVGYISAIRFSIDGGEPYYSSIRGRPLAKVIANIQGLGGSIPFGVNVVVSPTHVSELRRVAEMAIDLGAFDLLIIPEHEGGKVLLDARDWEKIDEVIADYGPRLRLGTSHTAHTCLTTKFLDTECEDEFVFAHVSADRKLKLTSYDSGGIWIETAANLRDYFLSLKPYNRSAR